MKYATRLAVLGLMLTVGCAAAPTELAEQDMTAIRARLDDIARHAGAEDNAAWANDYTEDAVFMAANEPAVRGRAALQKGGETGPKVTSLTFSDVQIHGRGNLAWATSAYSVTLEGVPAQDIGKQLLVLERQSDGSWRTLAASINSDRPASGG